jgi:hypothetical protein
LSFITYSWNQKGLVVTEATSSMEQMLMVESVKGTPNSSAARAASISPSACCMPVIPVGARATGMETFWPIIVVSSVRFVMSTRTRWRSLIFEKSLSFA